MGADLYIEDSPRNIELLRLDGHPAVVFSSSTNRHLPGPRAETWEDVYRIVQEKLAER